MPIGPGGTLVTVAITDCFPDVWITDVAAWATAAGYDADDAQQAAEEATWLLWQLTGGRFGSKYTARRDLYRHRSAVAKFRLRTGPVEKIYGVSTIDPATDVETAHTSWVDLRGGLLRIGSGAGVSADFRRAGFGGVCVQDDTLLQVEYLTKPNVPAGAERVAKKLATEFYKSLQGGPCALPDRVTTITRQQISWTLLDPMDFLEKNRTGMGPVDQWLSGVNLSGVTSVIDPLEWLEFVETEVIGCGQDFVPA